MEIEGSNKKQMKITNKNGPQEKTNFASSDKVECCSLCKQLLNDVKHYGGHPNNSNPEEIALTDDKLNVFIENGEMLYENELPINQITFFTVYDKNGHICPFDNGLIEMDIPLYFSGYLKAICDEDSSPFNGVPAYDLGPINEWCFAGYDESQKLIIAFTTDFGKYYLMKPSSEYESIFNKVNKKAKLSIYVVDYLVDFFYENPELEDLIQHLESTGEFEDVTKNLIQSAQFVYDQILHINAGCENNEHSLYTLPCLKKLFELADVSIRKYKILKPYKKTKNFKSKAVATKLITQVFKQIFSDEIDYKMECTESTEQHEVCKSCQSSDCDQFKHYLTKRKKGFEESIKDCKKRRCMLMANENIKLSDNKCDVGHSKNDIIIEQNISRKIMQTVKWKKEAYVKYHDRDCYLSAEIGDFTVEVGDFVMLKGEDENSPLSIVKIIYMYEVPLLKFVFHGQIFQRGRNSILGEMADPREIFVVDDCEEFFLESVVDKVQVEYRKIPDNWSQLGGKIDLQGQLNDNGKHFWYSKKLENNRFVDIDFNPEVTMENCYSCRQKEMFSKIHTPTLLDNSVRWKNEVYKIGTGVFLKPDVYNFAEKECNMKRNNYVERKKDKYLHTEYYRKKADNATSLNDDTFNPFVIGIIKNISESTNKIILIKVKIFFRPEHTFQFLQKYYRKDLNYLYYSDIEIETTFDQVAGKCYLTYGENYTNPNEWCENGPYRFYFLEGYNPETKQIFDIPANARNIGLYGKGKESVKVNKNQNTIDVVPDWESPSKPLRCMDIFSGCGGLSEGLKQSGLITSEWAMEIEVPAANAFKLNNPNCKIFIDDCNSLLKSILNGKSKEMGLPNKGEVEILVGGPPCQGFSGMNRFNSTSCSSFTNSLVVSYLSYCDYYRPKYFILENVRNFVSFKKGEVLKLTLKGLLAMGYQVTYGILQAGQYGIPQDRRRLIIMAAAPGYDLPFYPEPLNVFSKKGSSLNMVVDGNSYCNGCNWTESAPYRMITVRDALSDLPFITNDSLELEMPYNSDPITHFQWKIRKNSNRSLVRDHVCKKMSPLVALRIKHIPSYPGADWRDLPNIKLQLTNDQIVQKLIYKYRSKKQKPNALQKGVCHCVLDRKCRLVDKQSNTLIPWCLPHTADRHNQWAGLYGRLDWNGYFGTTITNPEPMGKQGRVLHPEQNRVVSVRECARSQGFPDNFRFCGDSLDKYRQIGNAVPPPLGYAIGREIIKALNKTSN